MQQYSAYGVYSYNDTRVKTPFSAIVYVKTTLTKKIEAEMKGKTNGA
ncbi:MAG: hypothetical protein WCQ94_06265 [Lachnospiraceae bacterium]|jgi:hypothetical protein|nr:hypothetical protein [Lachnospiraceae bacterium]